MVAVLAVEEEAQYDEGGVENCDWRSPLSLYTLISGLDWASSLSVLLSIITCIYPHHISFVRTRNHLIGSEQGDL